MQFQEVLKIGIDEDGKIVIRIPELNRVIEKRADLELEDIDRLKLIYNDNTVNKFDIEIV